MMKKLTLIAFTVMFIQTSMMAQGYHFVQHANGLEYICKDGDPEDDEHLFIWVGGSRMTETVDGEVVMEDRYFVEKNIRPAWRRAYNGSDDTQNGAFYKIDLDNVRTIAETRNNPDDYQGVEYFTNLESLTIASKNASSVDLDLSKNKKLTTLIFKEATVKLRTLNISNTQLTTLTIPSGSNSTLTNLTVSNSNLTSLNLRSCNALRVLDADNIAFSSNTALTLPTTINKLDELSLSGVTGLTSLNVSAYSALATLHVDGSSIATLTLPTVTGVLKHLNISNNPNLGDNYTHANPLDVSKYIRLVAVADVHSNTGAEFYYSNSGLTEYLTAGGNLKIYPENAEFITHVCDETEAALDYMDYTSHSNLIGLNLTGAKGVKLPSGRTTFILDLTGSPNVEEVDFDDSATTLTMLDAINVKKLDVSNCQELQELLYTGPQSEELVLSTTNGSHPDLTTLVLTKSSVTKLDLKGGGTSSTCIAPNLENFRAYYSALEEIDLSNHAQLTTLSLLPPKTGEDESVEDYGIDNFNEGNKLRKLQIQNCTSLTGGLTLNFEGESWKYYNAMEYLDASGCTGITRLDCQNNLLTHLDLSNCLALEEINITQGLLTGNGDIDLSRCSNLQEFNGSRNQWESMDFLLVPSAGRTAADIAKLKVVHVNGGSYTLTKENGDRYVREINGDPMIYTSRLTELDLSHLANGTFEELHCEDNLLTSLDLTEIGPGMTSLKCANNMMLTLNLNSLNHATLDEENSSWSPQVAYLNAEAVKGDDGTDETQGAHDWVALHLPGNEGFTHALDNNLALYENLWDYFNGGEIIAQEATPWMCKVDETDDIATYEGEGSKFAGNYLHHDGHTGYHLFLHSQPDISSIYGTYRDQDLYGKVLVYRYNTGYNQTLTTNPINGKTDFPNGTKITTSNELDPHIEIRAHIWPYIINLHPLTRNTLSQAQDNQLDYYSSTLYLDYDAVIPEGVAVYFVEGITSKTDIENNGTTTVRNQMQMNLFGGEGSDNNILPAYTPVYVRSRSKLKDGGEKTGQAGLYAFPPVWEFDIKGWENLRTIEGYAEAPHILHGVQKGDPRIIKPEYDRGALAAAREKKAQMMYVDDDGKKIGNILTGIMGEKSTETDLTAQKFNVYNRADTTVAARTCLTLSLQTQKINTRVIGFWPYNGTTVPVHRCVILEKDYNDAVTAAEKKGVSINQSTEAKGGAFFFMDDDTNVTGIETLSEEAVTTSRDGWFNLQGIRLNKQPQTHGVYIHNGRKVTIK
ncbi:MAG: hypothetical protein IJ605_03015 [Prevotella sp.]|nr:hypothetical protein [Prevotella sp.]